MNWAKGFFRLWIVLSLIYMAIVVSLEGKKLEGFTRPHSIFELEFAEEFTRGMDTGIPRDERRRLLNGYFREAAAIKAKRGDTATAKETLDNAEKHINDVFKAMDDRDEEKARDARVTAVALVGPPFALLIIGVLIAWIIRGFRRS